MLASPDVAHDGFMGPCMFACADDPSVGKICMGFKPATISLAVKNK